MSVKQTSSIRLYLRLLGCIKPYWKVVVIAFLATQIAAITEPLFAWLLGPLININFGAGSQQLPGILSKLGALFGDVKVGHLQTLSPIVIPLLLIAIFLLRGISTFISDYTATWLSNRLVTDLRVEMFNRVLRLPISYFDEHPSGYVMSRITSDVSSVTGAGLSVLTIVLKDSVTVIGQLALMLYIDWRLTLITLAALPLTGFSIRAAGKRLRGLNRFQQEAMRQLTQQLQESIQNIKLVKINNGQVNESSHFSLSANKVRQLAVKQTSASSANSAIVQLLIAVALAVVIYYASLRSAAGAMSAGDFMSFLTAMLMLSQPVQRLTRVNESLQKGLAAAESVFGLIDEVPESDEGRKCLASNPLNVTFDQVTFQYARADVPAIKSLSVQIDAGKTVAFVGSSGSGKSTLVQLLTRFYAVDRGTILINGLDLNEIQLSDLRQQIAFVSQDIMLFNDTIANNITYGLNRVVTLAELKSAAESANALSFIEQLPGGFDSMIGERGARLSGGQRQRIAIARAILKDAPLLILDEATSALDNESERLVQEALERLMRNRTTMVIAHRLSTIERADQICVMKDGQIVETGTHSDLISKQGDYFRLWQSQFKEQEKDLGQ